MQFDPSGLALRVDDEDNGAIAVDPTPFVIDNAGNVGIGTTTPAAKLDVAGSIKIVDGTQGSAKVLTSNAAGLASWQPAGGGGGWTDGGPVVRLTTTTDSVGIGTTGPEAKLHIEASGSAAILLTPTSGGARTVIMSVGIGSGAGFITVGGRPLTFHTDNVERMRITGTGPTTKVGIGTTIPAAALDVQTVTPGLKVGATCVSGSCPSDARLKQDIQYLSGSLATLVGLKPVAFRFTDDSHAHVGYGLLAQDVQQVAPHLVSQGEDGALRVDYSPLTMMLVEALKTQQAQLERLEARINELKAR